MAAKKPLGFGPHPTRGDLNQEDFFYGLWRLRHSPDTVTVESSAMPTPKKSPVTWWHRAFFHREFKNRGLHISLERTSPTVKPVLDRLGSLCHLSRRYDLLFE